MKWTTYQTGRAPVRLGGAVKLHSAVTAETVTLPPMTLADWYRLPAVVRRFHPWERARRALVIDAKTKRAVQS